MYKIFEQLCQLNQITPYKVSKATGISQATLSEWKRGNYVPKTDKLQKIADYFHVSIDYLITGVVKNHEEAPVLTRKDERDIGRMLGSMKAQLENQQGLMFDGDPATPEAIESILDAMEIGLQLAKRKNKEKYTPKKFKK